jgi:hypothetical protein
MGEGRRGGQTDRLACPESRPRGYGRVARRPLVEAFSLLLGAPHRRRRCQLTQLTPPTLQVKLTDADRPVAPPADVSEVMLCPPGLALSEAAGKEGPGGDASTHSSLLTLSTTTDGCVCSLRWSASHPHWRLVKEAILWRELRPPGLALIDAAGKEGFIRRCQLA